MLETIKQEYDIVEGTSPANLVLQVRKKLDQGWRLHGSPFFVPSIFCQAIVRGFSDTDVLLSSLGDITQAIAEIEKTIDRK